MIKIQNGIATREPIPAFLAGLAPDSLADLSWTDPALGVSGAAWWPEDDQSPALGEYERYGGETLTPDPERRVVGVVRAVVAWTADEIAAYRKSLVPEIVTMRQARLALLAAGLLDDVEAALSGMDGAQGQAAKIEWEYSQEVWRSKPFVQMLGAAIGLSELQIDDLFITAAGID